MIREIADMVGFSIERVHIIHKYLDMNELDGCRVCRKNKN